ncbi:MAG: hypothetical protein LBC53_09870 [Spirochaetaceae bacterium]|jgi:hypothetical protein|nr:hypothetical protein [Spirochaetaceae bacterium]
MDINIDGKDAQITLDTEKTLADVLAGLEEYLENAGFCAIAIEIDGVPIPESEIAGRLTALVNEVALLNVKTRTAAEMAVEALIDIYNFISYMQDNTLTNEQLVNLKTRPSLSYLKNKESFLYEKIMTYISNASYDEMKKELCGVIDERNAEIADPKKELQAMSGDVESVCERLASFPLDVQTGKDARAAETVEKFTFVMQKFFRLLLLSRFYGMVLNSFLKNEEITEFNSMLKEFLAAYENNDFVLSGDLAEYEIAPRFENLFKQILKNPAFAG